MHIYSLVLIALFIFNLIRKTNAKSRLIFQTTITMFVYIFTNRGYFLESSILNVDYWQAAIIFEFIVVLTCGHTVKISKRMAAFFLSMLISTLMLIALPATQARVVGNAGAYEYFMAGSKSYIQPMFTKFTVFLFVLTLIQAFAFDGVFRRFDIGATTRVIFNLARLSKLVIAIGVVELVIKNIFHSNIYNDLTVMFFGQGSSAYTSLVQRGSFYMLTGLNREGSQFVRALSVAVVLLYTEMRCKNSRKPLGWIVVSFMLMMFSGAFTMLIVFVMLFMFYIIYRASRNSDGRKIGSRILKYIFGIFTIAIVALIVYTRILSSDNYISNRLQAAVQIFKQVFSVDASYYTKLATIDSTTTRIYSVVHTLANWFYRPLFGLGPATTHCHGGSALMLAEIGIVGTITYIRFYYGRYIEDKCFSRLARPILAIWFIIGLLSNIGTRMYLGVDGVIILMAAYVINYFDEKKRLKGLKG